MASACLNALGRTRRRIPALLLELLPPDQWQQELAQDRLTDAEWRARALLGECLSDSEWDQFTQQGYLEVTSPSIPGRQYHIRRGGPVYVVEGDRTVAWLCVGPVEPLPADDVILLHLLMIRANEQVYLATANRFSC
jgi:hypothetical protein